MASSTYDDPTSKNWHSDLRYSVAFLRSQGFDVGFISRPLITNSKSLIKSTMKCKPEYVFLQTTVENFQTVIDFAKLLKEEWHDIQIILGGIPATLSKEQMLEQYPEIDWIIAGERELTLTELLKKHQKNQAIDNIQGLNCSKFQNKLRPLIPNLDVLGEMVLDEIDSLLSSSDGKEKVGYLLSSRGCYGRCTFCGIPSYYGCSEDSWRGRNAPLVVDEMQHLSNKFHLNYFVFEDDNFFGPGYEGQERAINIASEIIKRNLKLKFFFCCRVNDVQKNSFLALKSAGLDGIGLGVESTCAESLALFKKGLTPKKNYQTLDLLDKLEIKTEINMIFFDPYITIDGVQSNLDLLEYIREKKSFFYSSSFPFSELKPFPWSSVAKQLKKEGLLNEADYTCIYRDPKVSLLVEWSRSVRSLIPPIFKRRLFFNNSLNNPRNPKGLYQYSMLTPILRNWIGLYLLPRYMRTAIDLIEKNEDDRFDKLNNLKSRLLDEISPIVNNKNSEC